MADSNCPICAHAARIDSRGLVSRAQCPCCGGFEFVDQDTSLGRIPKPTYLLSHYLRRRHEETGRPFLIADRDGGTFPQNLGELPVVRKLELALLAVARKTKWFGDVSAINIDTDWPLAQSRNPREFQAMLEHWRMDQCLRMHDSNRPGYVLNGKGWGKVEELIPSRRGAGRRAFVAMSFDKKYDPLFQQIEDALRHCGWEAVRVDKDQYEEKICDRIVADIGRANLVIAECTEGNPNVLFEAGYAMGLGIPVVWCVNKATLDSKAVAFDTRQYPHLAWDKPADIRPLLVDRIQALYQAPG